MILYYIIKMNTKIIISFLIFYTTMINAQFCDPSQECLDDLSCGPGCICFIESNEGFCGNATV
jgi:hypothetical protein